MPGLQRRAGHALGAAGAAPRPGGLFANAIPRPPPPPLQVRIPAHCLTSNNRHVRARQLWGSDVYTEDSDLVAVLMHCGYWYHSRALGSGGGVGWGGVGVVLCLCVQPRLRLARGGMHAGGMA